VARLDPRVHGFQDELHRMSDRDSVDEATREHAIDPAAFMSALQFVAM
jgi:hypothetical protein